MQLIGWTLIHSIWEGGVIALVLALAFSAARSSSASMRYALGMIGLALMVALPIATTARVNTLAQAPVRGVAPSEEAPGATVGPPESSTSTDVSSSLTLVSPETEASAGLVAASPGLSARNVPDDFASRATSMLSGLESSLPWLVAAWLIGLVLLSIRMIGGVARTRRIVRDGTTASDRVLRQVSRLSRALGVRRAVRTLEGMHVTVPVVVGWVRPVIVLPLSLVTALTPSQLEMLLAHELAHIRRYDFLANMLQTVVETLLFFHPAAWWLSDRIREERENCCDDIAVATCGGDRKGYTATLLALEESRDNRFGFAAAATGGGTSGTLLRRAMRLMTGGPAHVDLGARWIAGVITIFAVLLTTGPTIGRAANVPGASRLDVLGFLGQESDSVPARQYGLPDPARSNPDTILRYIGNGSFAERWRWAEQRASSLRSSRYWIGYLVAGDPTGRDMYYMDRETPVRSGSATFMGRMRIGDARDLIFSGAALAPLVGNHASTSTAIFLQFEKAGGADQLRRVHVGSFRFPVYFGGAPAIWLDSATDAESIVRLRTMVENPRSLEVQRDLVSAVGMHRDANAALPPLVEWLGSRDAPEAIRREAAEALGDFPDARAVAALARVARNDRSSAVRKEAIEAFEHMRFGAATDTLMAFATNLESSSLRHVAIEALGARHEPRVIAFLTRIARGNDDMKLRTDAVEALGSMHEEGFAAIADLARHASDADVRRQAVEEIANSQPAGRALDLLREIIQSDRDELVRLEAVETLAEVHDDRAATTLRDLVMRSPDPAVQVKATEALGDAMQSDSNVRELVALARTHPRAEVRKEAIETLGDVHEGSATSALVAIARSDADPELRRAAIEALGNQHSQAALDAVRGIAQAAGPEHVRRQAMETYADNTNPQTAVAFLKSIIAGDPSQRIRLEALEILSELDHDAGIPAVREVAAASADSRVRNRALEILSER
ncbi:MAG TPA: HEAT repeat domain-containing protein [Rhodothermia bacterium]|nr:HEAT repeat domain-containing protein [Rhodothermia bacterium]